MTVVQEGGDHEGRAGRPWIPLVQIGQGGGHHVGAPVETVDARAQLGIVMRHVEDVTWKADVNRYFSTRRTHSPHVTGSFRLRTQFVRHCKSCLQSIVLNNGAASVRVAHGANICHPQGVTGVGTAQILTKQVQHINERVFEPFPVRKTSEAQLTVLVKSTAVS